MSGRVKVTVVIPTWNGREALRECCAALRRQEFGEFRVRVVDNASTDGTVEMLAREFPEVGVIRLRRNLGFARAVNRGIRAGADAVAGADDGPCVAVLNNDAIPEPAWLGELVRRARSAPREDFWASVLLWADRPDTIQSAGLSVRRDGTPARLSDGEPVASLGAEPYEVLGASAAAALYRRSMLARVGLFDERFFAYAEDVDLSLRARLLGCRCALVSTARVLHRRMWTSKRAPSLAAYLQYRNVVLYLLKTMPSRRLLAQLPRFALSGLRPLVARPWRGEGWALMAARFGIAKHLPHALRERARLRRRSCVTIDELEPLLAEAAGTRSGSGATRGA